MHINKGFTLAEVLIVLLIIGVISSLVIPAIINDTNEAEFNTGLKKINADLAQAIKVIQANNGSSVNVGNGSTQADHIAIMNEFCNVMTCIETDTVANIFGTPNYNYYKGGNSGFPDNGTAPAAVLNNGALLRVASYSGCTTHGVNACGYINIDINGKKGPKMIGKDFYSFYIVHPNGSGAYSILPFGAQGDTYAGLPTGCTTGSSGWNTSEGCTSQRLLSPASMP